MSWPIDCANCGKQVLAEGIPGEKCVWCGKSPYKKEVTMKQPIKPEKMNPRAKHAFVEKHQEEIIEDIGRLKVDEVLAKWGIGRSSYYKLKRKKTSRQPPQGPADKEAVVKLTEHERYLILLGYQMATREFLKSE